MPFTYHCQYYFGYFLICPLHKIFRKYISSFMKNLTRVSVIITLNLGFHPISPKGYHIYLLVCSMVEWHTFPNIGHAHFFLLEVIYILGILGIRI